MGKFREHLEMLVRKREMVEKVGPKDRDDH
jgi:hypothetical protein